MRGGQQLRGLADMTTNVSAPLLLLWWYTATLGNRNPIHEQGKKKRKRWFKTHPERVTAPRGTYIFPPDQKNPRDIKLETKGRHHQWSHPSHSLSWPFPSSLSAPFPRFLRNDARIKAAPQEPPGKGKYTFFGKIPVFSVRVFDIHTRVRWGLVLFQGLFLSYRTVLGFFCVISLLSRSKTLVRGSLGISDAWTGLPHFCELFN